MLWWEITLEIRNLSALAWVSLTRVCRRFKVCILNSAQSQVKYPCAILFQRISVWSDHLGIMFAASMGLILRIEPKPKAWKLNVCFFKGPVTYWNTICDRNDERQIFSVNTFLRSRYEQLKVSNEGRKQEAKNCFKLFFHSLSLSLFTPISWLTWGWSQRSAMGKRTFSELFRKFEFFSVRTSEIGLKVESIMCKI